MSQLTPELKSVSVRKTFQVTFSPARLLVVSLIYLAALGAAEYTSHFWSPVGGIVFYLLIIFSLIVNTSISGDEGQRGFWLALGLAPITRIISLVMPVRLEVSPILWYLIITIPVLAGVIALARALKYSLADIITNLNNPAAQIAVAFEGIFMGAVGYVWLRPQAWTSQLSLLSTLFPALVLLLCTGFVEELAFRGVMQRAAGVLGSYGWVYIAVVYAVLQIQQGSLSYCLFALAAGLFFGLMVKRTGSILGVSLAHGLINIGLYLVYPHLFAGM